MNNKAGLEFDDPGFRPMGHIVLKLLFSLPPSVRERLLFNSPAVCVPLQKALQRSLGRAFAVETRFTAGPLSIALLSALHLRSIFGKLTRA